MGELPRWEVGGCSSGEEDATEAAGRRDVRAEATIVWLRQAPGLIPREKQTARSAVRRRGEEITSVFADETGQVQGRLEGVLPGRAFRHLPKPKTRLDTRAAPDRRPLKPDCLTAALVIALARSPTGGSDTEHDHRTLEDPSSGHSLEMNLVLDA